MKERKLIGTKEERALKKAKESGKMIPFKTRGYYRAYGKWDKGNHVHIAHPSGILERIASHISIGAAIEQVKELQRLIDNNLPIPRIVDRPV